MGQYYTAACIDNLQYVKPHDFGDGAKLMEFGMSSAGMAMAVAGLLTFNADHRGPWAGSRVVVTGDYADEGRFVPPAFSSVNLYTLLNADDEDDVVSQARDAGIPIPETTSITDEAKAWLVTLLGDSHEGTRGALGSRQLVPIAALEDATLVFDQPEDLVLAMDRVPGDSPAEAVSDMHQALRMNQYPSALAWASVESSSFVEDPATGRVTEWTVRAVPRDTPHTAQTLSLKFPAKKAAIRKWFGLAK